MSGRASCGAATRLLFCKLFIETLDLRNRQPHGAAHASSTRAPRPNPTPTPSVQPPERPHTPPLISQIDRARTNPESRLAAEKKIRLAVRQHANTFIAIVSRGRDLRLLGAHRPTRLGRRQPDLLRSYERPLLLAPRTLFHVYTVCETKTRTWVLSYCTYCTRDALTLLHSTAVQADITRQKPTAQSSRPGLHHPGPHPPD